MPFQQILLATHNPGKLREIQQILSDLPVGLLLADDVGIPADFDVAETGATYQENAELKAKAFSAQAFKQISPAIATLQTLPTLADDSGLSVDALNGRPGVHSKRLVAGNDQDRNREVLRLMEGKTDRSAHFTTVLCLYLPAAVHFFVGEVHGTIAHAEKGHAGFGYDSIFIPDGYKKTFAELGEEVKNRESHRAKALQKLRDYLLANGSSTDSTEKFSLK